MKFYLGTHEWSWLWSPKMEGVPLFVSHRRLKKRKSSFPRAVTSWALDSGGFSELSIYGKWKTSVSEYIEAICQYHEELGSLEFAAPMDWMTEPWIVDMTGLSVRAHQEKTVANYLNLLSYGLPVEVIPVIQGWEISDYEKCLDIYRDAGVDLSAKTCVGVGSVCRRQSSREVYDIFSFLSQEGLSLHGFGVKTEGLRNYGKYLKSADSMSWSFQARRRYNASGGEEGKLPGCTHPKGCNNCSRYALYWREQVLEDFLP